MTDGLKDAHREAIIAALAADERVERAVLFGSRATGTNTLTSDVDIALFGDRLTLTDQARLATAIDEIPMAQTVDLLLYDSISDRTLRDHIRKHGVEWHPRATHQWRQGVYGRVLAEYVEEPLERLCVPERGIQTGPFGSQLHKRDYVSAGTPIVTVEHLGANRLVHRHLPRVSDADRDRLSKYRLKAGDIVFSRVGSVDRRALVRQEEEGWLFSGRCLRVRGDPDRIDPAFLSYFFGWNAFREHIRSIAVGATMPSLNTRLLSSIVVPYPPLHEQRSIAHVLGTLDDKIELNRRMNDTLEGMSRALFKSWFVDFDPVLAKMEGRDTGLPPDIADLFPDRMVDSEMGEIPEGWEVRTLGDLIELAYGKSLPKKKRKSGNVPVYGSNGQIGWHNQQLVDGPGIIVGRKGNPGFVRWCPTKFFPIDTTFFVVPRGDGRGMFFLYHLLRTQDLPSIASDSAVPGMNRNLAYMNRAVVPSKDVAGMFTKSVKANSERQRVLGKESRILAALRDTLLPKLISGEIRVPAAARPLEAAT
ncbi:restriction endonuclease subunit S [Candidatus Palauibacter sp.]|uniref:restriction endonuclease subunit S n=1 Tax=Candidatus Palauibacter sp. TaxID=3101350 RepID=UPI003B51C353